MGKAGRTPRPLAVVRELLIAASCSVGDGDMPEALARAVCAVRMLYQMPGAVLTEGMLQTRVETIEAQFKEEE